MGSKGNEISDENYENASSQYSINEGDVLPLVKSRERENQQQAASKTTNQVSVSSSYDSFAQTAGSKAMRRFSNIDNPPEEVAEPQKLISGGTVAKNQFSHNPPRNIGQKGSCIEVSKGAEGHDDLTSCVSTPKNCLLADDCPNRSIDLKNISCSSISAGSNAASASLDEHSSVKYLCGASVVPGECADNSSQKLPPCISIGISSHEESLEAPLQENFDAVGSSVKVQGLTFRCQSHASPYNSNDKGLEENASLHPLEKLRETFIRHMSSSAEETGPNVGYDKKSAACEDSKAGLIGEGSKVMGEISVKSKLEVIEEIGDQLDATVHCFDQTEQVDKSKELVELSGVQESPPVDETGEPNIVEQDVKVCDICGDAGREDLLAVCCRCSDGAEHTYCMRDMLKKVPEGEWLCEECKYVQESENRNEVESNGGNGNASSRSSGYSIHELPLKLDVKGSKADAKATSKVSASPRVSGKRSAENTEVGSTVKRQALEASIGSPKTSPNEVSALSRDSLFKSLEKGKVRQVHQTSNGNYIAESTRSPSNGARPQISQGALLKFHSFSTGSSKPKVKLVDDVPLKQIGGREHASHGLKDGAMRTLCKSMSFKPPNSGRSNDTESKIKMFSPKISQDQDHKGLKHAKDQNTLEKKNLSTLDHSLVSSAKIISAVSTPKGYHKLASHGESSLSSISNNRDLKVAQADGKLASISRSTSNFGCRGAETTVVSGGVSSTVHRPNQLSVTEDPSSSSLTAGKSSSNANGGLQDDFPRLRESTNQTEKTKESSIGHSRQIVTAGIRTVACQKCKEVGHDAEYCTVATPQAYGIDVSTVRNSREEMKEGNNLKAAITAAMLKKPGIYKKKPANVKVEELSASKTDVNSELASQDKLSVHSISRNVTYAERIHDGKAVLQSGTLDSKPMIVTNVKQTASNPRETVDSLKAGDANSIFASDGKPAIREVSSYVFAAMEVCKAIAIPEHEYIWQGNFKLHRGGKQPELCAGFQAHVSASASRKVIEVVNQFPHNVSFSEVPRLSAWPRQFHESGAKEENIAIYFFAKDLESYRRNYKWLVESMIKNDFALKVNLDGVELLVFPSSQLPEKSQRWNMLFFLWGVFRGKKANGSDHTSDSSNNLDMNSLNTPPVNKDIPGALIYSSENHSSPKCKDENLSSCDKSLDVVLASDTLSAGNSNGDCNIKSEPVDQKCLRTVVVSEQQHSNIKSHSLPMIQTSSSLLCQEIRCSNTSTKEASDLGSKWKVDLQPSVRSFRASSGYNEGEKIAERWDSSLDTQKVATYSHKIVPVGINDEILDEKKKLDVIDSRKDAVKVVVDFQEDASMRSEAVERELSRNEEVNKLGLSRKRPHLDLGEIPLEASQNMAWNRTNNKSLAGGEDHHIKKLKTGISGVYGSDGCVAKSDGHACELPPCSSSRYERLFDKKVILEDLGSAERFFPVASASEKVKDMQLGWKSEVPNLELALGGETKQTSKGFLPFLGGRVEKQSNHSDLPGTVKGEEDVSASLSLSLSFPFPD